MIEVLMVVHPKPLPVTQISVQDKSWAGTDQSISTGLQEMLYLAMGTPAISSESCKFVL